MAGVTAQGGTFTFGTSVTMLVTAVTVETPTAKYVDMTSTAVTSASTVILVPTGEWTGGSISADCLELRPRIDPQSIVGRVGELKFESPGFSVTRRSILESATTSGSVGDIVKSTLKFRFTEHTATNI